MADFLEIWQIKVIFEIDNERSLQTKDIVRINSKVGKLNSKYSTEKSFSL
jgi:hypothetical protein